MKTPPALPIEPTIGYQPVKVPAALLFCPAPLDPPALTVTDKELAHYLLALDAGHRACHTTVEELARFLHKQATVPLDTPAP